MIRRLGESLDRHWFGPLPEFYLSLARVVVFGGLLFFLLSPFPFGEPKELARQHWAAAIDGSLYQPIPALKVLLLPLGRWGAVRPSPELLQAIWLIAVATAIVSVLGIRPRLNMLCCAAATTLLYAHAYSYHEFHHPEAALVIALWVFALGPITGAGSWERLIARGREAVRMRQFRPRLSKADARPLIRWPLRLIQWVLVLVYFSAGLSKLINGGPDWLNGHTLAYYFAKKSIDTLGGAGIGLWLAQYPSVLSLLSLGTLVFELTFVLAVLFPRLAWVYVVAGTAMHAGFYIMLGAAFFQFIPLYIVFAEAMHPTIHAARAATKRMIEAVRPLRGHEARNPAT